MKTPNRRRRANEQGQILVIFAGALVALVAILGLIIDGGGAFAQSRNEQKAADLAALAGANDYFLNSQATAAITRAAAVALTNGYADGTTAANCPLSNNRTTVSASVDAATAKVTVTITAPHPNGFARIFPGMECWPVTTTATAKAGIPDTASGVAPMLFNIDAFGTNGQPLPQYGDPDHPFTFDHGTSAAGDAPAGPGNMAWTDWAVLGNLNTDIVRNIITGDTVITKTLTFGEYIGQHNNGQHAELFGCIDGNSLCDGLIGLDLPVPVVDANGHFQGWATFHVVSASQGGKSVKGYFTSPFLSESDSAETCLAGECPRYLGTWTLELTN
jgi:Flp pilus assembly protein TadG